MSLPIVQIKRRNKDTGEEYSTAQLLNGLIEGELGFNYFDKSLWIGPLGSSTGREYSVLVNSDHKLYDGSWVNGTTAGPLLSLRDYETRNSSFNSITLPSIPSASAGASGVVTTGAQTFAGLKTFNNGIKNIGNFVFTNAAGSYSATLVGPNKNVTFNMPDTGGTIVTHATKGQAVGSASQPVYIAATGRATAGSKYAGGTAVTLNGTSKSAASASFYAPTTPGSIGQVLISAAANADPTWVNQRTLDVGKLEGYTRSNLYADLPTWLSAVGLTYTITVDGDKDTYYPVRIYLSSAKSIPTIVSIYKNLGSPTPAYSTGNHSNGTSSMWIVYEGRNRGWDGNGGYIKTLYYHMSYAQLCAEVKQGTEACGDIIVWLRGGGCEYKIATTSKASNIPAIYYTETNVGTTEYPDLVAPRTTVGNAGIYSSTFLGYGDISGNSATTTKLKNSRNIFGKSFNGTADVAGQALVYGTYTSTASQRYANGGLQIREAGLVGDKQTDIGYAPAIGFHWNKKKAASLLFHHDGLFYFRAQDGTTRATVDANLQGNASTATALTSSAGSGTQPIYFSNGKPVATTYALHKTVPSNAAFTDVNVAQGRSTTSNWRPILSHYTHSDYNVDPGTKTGSVYYHESMAIQPSTGTIRATKFKGNLDGVAANATKLQNYYSSRPTTIDPGIMADGSVISFKCTSSVTDATTDPGDGHILHFNWDNNGGYDAQMYLATGSSTLKYRGMNAKSWSDWVTSIDSGNYTQYTVKKDGTGASGTWNISINGTASKAIADADGNKIKTTYAKVASMNNLVHSGNEITMVPDKYSGELWLNYRTCGGSNGNITKYNFGDGKQGTSVTLVASKFSGVAAKATTLETARSIFGQSFNGGADVKGTALVYGTYNATANQRYNSAGLQIREADQVLATQSDIGYAPSISFHWGNRVAATLLLHHDGIFYFRKQDGVTRATVDANVTQVNGVTPEWAGSISNADARWIAAWTSDGKKIKALDKNTMTVLGASQATGTTFSIKNSSGGDVDLIFDRNTNASWKILNSQGNLHFQNNWTSSKGGYYDVMKLYYNSGNVEIKGSVKVGGGCTLEYDSSQQSLKFIFT